tara:strand:- start:1729 stop:2433 length:705 start_codon:yes stop_codon:yes gene_type:complete
MINHKYKCIFIHIHKTAGGAIWPSFNYNPNDSNQNLIGGIHHSAEMLKNFYGEQIWNEYFKFTIVRSPWGKKVGSYEHTRRKHASYHINPKYSIENYFNWLKTFRMPKPPLGDYHDLNQIDWLTINGKIDMDYVIRFEHLKEDWKEVVNILKIEEPNELTWGGHSVNTYAHPEAYHFKQNGLPQDYSKYYTKESENYVAARWKRDIEHFGFKFMSDSYNKDAVQLLNTTVYGQK